MMEAEIGVMCFEEGGRKGSGAKENRWPLEPETGKEMDSPLRGSKRNQPCRHLSSWTLISGLQNHKRINLYCFMP